MSAFFEKPGSSEFRSRLGRMTGEEYQRILCSDLSDVRARLLDMSARPQLVALVDSVDAEGFEQQTAVVSAEIADSCVKVLVIALRQGNVVDTM